MWKWIDKRDTNKIKDFLARSTPKELREHLTSRNPDGNQPLMVAVSNSYHDLIHLLLNYKKHIDINAKDIESGYTVLHKALLNGDLIIVTLLIRNFSVDFSIRDREGLTCLEMFQVFIINLGGDQCSW